MHMNLRLAIGLTAFLALTIAVLTLLPATPGPQAILPHQDKLHHFIAFAALAFPIAVARPQWVWTAGLIMLIFGGLIEVIQPYVGRGREFADLVADGVGIMAGSALGLFVNRLLRGWTA